MSGVTVNLGNIRGRLNEQAFQRGRYAFANQAMADMNPFVPKKDNDLRQSAHVSADGRKILYEMPYARKQFYVPAKKYSTPGTGARWDLKARALNLPAWKRAFLKGAGL